MSGFQAVNTTTLTVPDLQSGRAGETSPTTPRPGAFFSAERPTQQDARIDETTAKTPTRDSFIGLAGQKPLPSSPFTPSQDSGNSPQSNDAISKSGSKRSSRVIEEDDLKMEEGDDVAEGSDNDDTQSENNSRPSKKKKGQRFFCTEFPPCQLSFTRSEHLARHIRYDRCFASTRFQ
jgi:C2H2 transcription facotor